jgi:tetratricopeptide (TPR) repeat protein
VQKAGDGGEEEARLDFFVSYTADDYDTAVWIAEELTAQGYVVRYQHGHFRPGGEFPREIDESIARAGRVIAVLSGKSLESDWCRREWDAAGDKILLLRVEDVEVEGLLGVRTFVDLFGPGTDKIQRRARLLRAIAGQQPAPGLQELEASIELPRRCAPFIGREERLNRIYEHFHEPRAAVGPRRLTLVGIAGIGKGVLAVEYAHRMREYEKYEHVWFVRADKPEALEAQMRVLVNEVQVPRSDLKLGDQVRSVLARRPDWLLIFDHVPDLASIADYLPASGNGHILITSENEATWGGANLLPVSGWSEDEAVRFLIEETGQTDQAAAEALAEEFDGHPEALIQAAAYIGGTGRSIAGYLEMHRRNQDHQEDKSAAHLALAIDRIEETPLAVDVLRFGSFLAADRIPVELLMEGLRAGEREIDERLFDEAVQALRQFSLVRRDDPYLSFSRLVQTQVRGSAQQRGDAAMWLEAGLLALDRMFPTNDELTNPGAWPRAAALLPHLLVLTDQARDVQLGRATVGRLLCRAGSYLGIAERLPAARAANFTSGASIEPGARPAGRSPIGRQALTAVTLLADAQRILEEEHGRDHLDVSEAMAVLGQLHRVRGEYDEAIRLLSEAYQIVERLDERDSLIGAMRLIQLARAERDAGGVSSARKKFEEAAAVAEQHGPSGRRVLAEALASLGIALSRQGRFAEAIERLKHSIQLHEALWGADHFEVAMTLGPLGDALAAFGDPEAAKTAYERKILIELHAYGEQSPARGDGLLTAAIHAAYSNDLETARELVSEILSLAGEEAAADDATASWAFLIEAHVDRRKGGVEWRELLDRASQALGEAGLPDVRPRLMLVDYLVEDGDASTAVELAARLRQERTDARDWPNAAQAALSEATARDELGELEQAASTLRSLTQMIEQRTEIDESQALHARLQLGDAVSRLNRPEEALATYCDVYRAASERGYVLVQADALAGRSECLIAEGVLDEAVDALQTALELRSANLVNGHELVVATMVALARAEGARGNEAEARTRLEDAVAATAARAGARSAAVSRVYMSAAWCLATLGRSDEAANRAEEALRILEGTAELRDLLSGRVEVGFLMSEVRQPRRALELATAVRELVDVDTLAGRRLWARATNLAVHAALDQEDPATARELAEKLVDTMVADPRIAPRLKAASWLVLADVEASADPEKARDAVEQARRLEVDTPFLTRREIALRAAELDWRLGHEATAVALAEELLPTTDDGPFRLQVLRVLILAALDAGLQERAANHLPEAALLADQDRDRLRQAAHRTWVASGYRRLGRRELSAAVLACALADLREHAGSEQPARTARVAGLFEDLAAELGAIDELTDAIAALEQAHDLYLKADDRAGLANVMDRLAQVTKAAGDSEASRQWLERVQGFLPELEGDLQTAVIQLNLGLRYLDMEDFGAGRDALERALGDYDRVRGEDQLDASYFLVPLIRASLESGNLEAVSRYAERALACNLHDPDEWDPDYLDALVIVIRAQAEDDELFDRFVDLVRQLADARLPAAARAELFGQLAYIRGNACGWDDVRAYELVAAARDALESTEDRPADLYADLAVLQADAYVARGEAAEASSTLLSSAESLRDADEQHPLAVVMLRLGELRLLGDAAAAADCFAEAKSALERVGAPLAESLQVQTALAEAHLRAGARTVGIGELRHAARLVEIEEPEADPATVIAMCRLASTLLEAADDRTRALEVLARAETVNADLLARETPDTEAVSALSSVVQDIRGNDAAFAIVTTALREAPQTAGALTAMANLVVQAGLTAEDALDFVADSEDPAAIATTSRVLADALAFVDRHDDARAVLRHAIDRVRASEATPSVAASELDLLGSLSELDDMSDRAEALACLARAEELADAHPDLQGPVRRFQVWLGLALGEGEMWEKAIELLAGVEPDDDVKTSVEWCLAVGRVMIGRYEEAKPGLDRLVTDSPDHLLFVLLATAETKTGQHQAALDSVAEGFRYCKTTEEFSESLLLCTEICSDIAEYEAAVGYAEAAIEITPDNPDAYQMMAWALEHLGSDRTEACEAAYQRAFDLATDASDRLYALKGRAGARRALGRDAEAREDFERVLAELDPSTDPWLEGWIRYNLDEYDEAAAAFERALAVDDDRTAARFDLALCHAVAGKPDAIEMYRNTLAFLDEWEPRNRLAPVRVARSDLREAEFIHDRLKSTEAFQAIVGEVESSLQRTEDRVTRPFLPPIPPPPRDVAEEQ